MRSAQARVGVLAIALLAAWLIVDPRTPDLAGQVYRLGLYRELGLAVYDTHWYAGHDLPGYSLLFSPLASLLGLRVLGVLSVLASTLLFERLVRSIYGPRAVWGAALFALAAVGDVWAGRLTFALGVPFALAAVLALREDRTGWAALAAALSAAASPVAGVLLGLAALTAAIAWASPRPLLVLALPAAVVVLALVALFPEGGWEPYPLLSFLATVLVVGACAWALPPAERTLRIGAVVYLLACVLALVVRSPLGSNIERYAVLLAGPLLACALLAGDQGAGGRSRARLAPAGALALCAALVWILWGPVRETIAVAGSPATSASYYAPLERFLESRGGSRVRVEVPLSRSHWEAALLAPHVSLARGWEKQLEERYDGPLLSAGLQASAYRRWLAREAVAYVALPDVPLDPSSAREGRIVRSHPPYLREVWRNAHWRVYSVLGAVALLSGPGHLTSLGHDSFTVYANTPGRFVVRVHYTPYWTLVHGRGCVGSAPGGWTAVTLERPGRAVVAARFSLTRAFASGASCA